MSEGARANDVEVHSEQPSPEKFISTEITFVPPKMESKHGFKHVQSHTRCVSFI